jgi:hemerythrin-like domain-containing protein
MRLVGMLKEDHKAMDLMLKILESICRKLESGERVESEHLDDVLDFMKDFVVPDNAVGESLVLSAIEEAGVRLERGALIVMSTERNTLREYAEKLQKAATNYKGGDPDAVEQVVHIARSYIFLLRREMEIEEKDIYSRLEIHLSTAQQSELADRLERSGTSAKYGAVQRLEKIQNAYLSRS